MSADGGTRAVIAALLANLGIAVAKFVAFALTGSSSMLAEAVHSVADSGNQGLLLVGNRQAKRAATDEHPFGYGSVRYFYAFVVALVIFALGSLFALFEGVTKLLHPHEVERPIVAVAVLVVALVLEGLSFRTAIVESNRIRGRASWAAFIRRAKAPELPVVLLEDFGALVGLALALAGVGLTWATGNPIWDGVGTVCIGILLGAIAAVLIAETKSLLIGESADPEVLEKIRTALVGGQVDRMIHLRAVHLGPEELLVGAKISLVGRPELAQVAAEIDAAESRVRQAVPIARVIYLEPDLFRAPTVEDREHGG
ncbi:MAG: cation diffusion facilitator family transporter [Actinobacteria bacterium]|nr:cation diffusion facilitator family transporter [Actinomycetota bacterium]MBI3687839.1 cation diffusion facilitator family transporter [Actinomycetota bacterium]